LTPIKVGVLSYRVGQKQTGSGQVLKDLYRDSRWIGESRGVDTKGSLILGKEGVSLDRYFFFFRGRTFIH